MKKINGFGFIGLIISIAVIAMLSVGGYYTYFNNQNSSSPYKKADSALKQAQELTNLNQQRNADLTNALGENNMGNNEKLNQVYNQAKITTNLGSFTIEFYNDDAPITVNNFLKLAQNNFYDNTAFHRVIKDFMIQGGDPLSKDEVWTAIGTGGPGYKFEDEFNDHKLVKGSLAMANSGPNTNGSQFFIVTADETPWLDGKHTNFGRVIEGMDVIETIGNTATNAQDQPLKRVVIEKIELYPVK